MSIPADSQAVPHTDPEFPLNKLVDYVARLLADGKPDIYRRVIHEVDRHLLQEVMTHCRNNQLQAAERLGISRMTLRSKLRSLGMLASRSNDSKSS